MSSVYLAHHEEPFECDECGRSFATKADIKEHHISSHIVKTLQDLSEDIRASAVCGKKIKEPESKPQGPLNLSKSALQTHLKRSLKCKICYKSFKTDFLLQMHRQKIITSRFIIAPIS